MNQPRPSTKDRFDRYRALASSAVPVRHVFADADGIHLQVETFGEVETICTIYPACPQANRSLIIGHIETVADLIHMMDAAALRDEARCKEIGNLKRELEKNTGRPAKDYAAECAMKCTEPGFQRFLAECHDLPLPTDGNKAATKVKSLLAIESRKTLNTDAAAAARWRELVKHFEAWRRRG